MKVISTAAITLLAGSANAFAPSASQSLVNSRTCTASNTCVSMALPFFAQEEEKEVEEAPAASPVAVAEEEENAVIAEALKDQSKRKAEEAELDSLSMEDEVELLVQKELGKTKRMSNLRNTAGVEYAPWMGISEDEENKIRSLMRDRTEARRKRQIQEQDVSGNLFRDSQAQELSGTGLSYKLIDGEVELSWATKSESDTKGFIVKRRAAKTNDYSVIASYADFGPLASKGREGGLYRFLDSSVTPGGWVYRISEEDNMGNEADVCQCLVEVETEDEQKAALIAGVGFAVFAVLAVVAGVAIDPMNGY
mmetsp:Transcript_28487/g.46255  ORF Transcript_28487/g.46255 Transcript_28487/m.46255 type:complete len:309 (+) Transcript_28487:72-998(+)|eukprot:CAMPEP_0196142702 /NCGR_PEP_ID=MMETSP0910-20130528/12134_1 /TAXON_ID=49265 /ORGANISM="Thalassiosira rotula, Strain GSO102" /LENGTH=308 /DNA_ID=CAMNT_0041404055 /DNA_START=114 /DNA_END=1040 /DNA_ORIENTATION=-